MPRHDGWRKRWSSSFLLLLLECGFWWDKWENGGVMIGIPLGFEIWFKSSVIWSGMSELKS